MAFRHGKNTAVLVGAYNLSAYFQSAQVANSVMTAETTTYGAAGGAKTYVTGLNDSTVSLSGLFDGAAGAVDSVLQAAIGTDTDINYLIAQDGGMVVGRPCLIGQSILTKYSVDSPVADVVKTSADLQSDAGNDRGIILADLTAISATANGTSVDNGAATSNGGYAFLFVPTNTRNGTVTVKVQHSSDNSTWVDLTFTNSASSFTAVSSSATTSERLTVALGSNVNRYLRAQYTVAGSSGSTSIAVAFTRL
jgi:hypothetical protein